MLKLNTGEKEKILANKYAGSLQIQIKNMNLLKKHLRFVETNGATILN